MLRIVSASLCLLVCGCAHLPLAPDPVAIVTGDGVTTDIPIPGWRIEDGVQAEVFREASLCQQRMHFTYEPRARRRADSRTALQILLGSLSAAGGLVASGLIIADEKVAAGLTAGTAALAGVGSVILGVLPDNTGEYMTRAALFDAGYIQKKTNPNQAMRLFQECKAATPKPPGELLPLSEGGEIEQPPQRANPAQKPTPEQEIPETAVPKAKSGEVCQSNEVCDSGQCIEQVCK